MTPNILRLQAKYANAIYQAQRYTREAEIAKGMLDQLANAEAEAQFPAQQGLETLKNRRGGE